MVDPIQEPSSRYRGMTRAWPEGQPFGSNEVSIAIAGRVAGWVADWAVGWTALLTGPTTCLTDATALLVTASLVAGPDCPARGPAAGSSPALRVCWPLGLAGVSTPPTGATRPTLLVAGSSTGATGAMGLRRA